LAALHHSLQDGPLQEIVQLVEFLPGLAEALVGGAKKGRAGALRAGMIDTDYTDFGRIYSYWYNTVVLPQNYKTFSLNDVTFVSRPAS
jgi:hypothetical protein